ncbi:sugar ABC transporter permease [Anaerocolumna aminovalerica]|jgi:ABC-type sugar transport system permease subunit|uniref:Multiple sugar transport system permease protein n=2 Tax=Anaerocolumna aminovalerica TaxID=1527 RepID=A0A1I5C1J2_9FIRM|nr:sugar ABC transporter permease [Anaerocolumna aminovalerica]SFN80776.1 multiple sugar transport system permease protein [Anaerocolumna aminovalerica]
MVMPSNDIIRTRKRNINNIAYLYVLPFVFVFIMFSIYPVFKTLYLSFTQYKGYGEPIPVGISNYKRVISDAMFWRALINTIKIWSVNIVLQLGLAFLLTIIFNDLKYRIKGIGLFRALFYLPNLIAPASVAFLFAALLDWQFGTLNQLLIDAKLVKVGINWFGQPGTAQLAVSVIGAWMWFGNSFIMLMAGVQGISKDYFEAAAIDGAGRWHIFGKITLPLLKPILLYVAITSLIGGLQIFDIPFLITDGIGAPHGSLNTVVMYLYNTAFRYNNVGYAGAIAYFLFLVIAVAAGIQYKIMYHKREE